MERGGEPAGEHLASEISPVRGSDKIEAACGLLSNSEGPGPPLDLKDFIKKASGGVWGGRGRSSRGALLVAKTQSVRTRSQLGGRGGDIGNTCKGSQPTSARQAGPSHPGEKRRPGCSAGTSNKTGRASPHLLQNCFPLPPPPVRKSPSR